MTEEIIKAIENLRMEVKADIESVNVNIDKKFSAVIEDVKEIKLKQIDLEKKTVRLDKEIRKRNIIIHGLEETENNQDELKAYILDLINQSLNVELENKEIDMLHRLGQKSEKKIRPILLGVTTYIKKNCIMENKYKLRNLPFKIYLNNDLPKEIAEQNNKLRTAMKQLKKMELMLV